MRQSTLSLEQELLQLGFSAGAPANVPPEVVATDVRIYRSMRCAACAQRRHAVIPYHRGREYRLVCTCQNPKCKQQTEA